MSRGQPRDLSSPPLGVQSEFSRIDLPLLHLQVPLLEVHTPAHIVRTGVHDFAKRLRASAPLIDGER